MIELYRWEPNAESLALLIGLNEKGLEFEDRYVDVLALDNHAGRYRKLSPAGAVPLLVVDGEPMPDAGIALQYLEEAHPGERLGPADPGAWYDMQAWMSRFAGPFGLGASVNLLGWNYVMLKAMPADALAAYRDGLAALPKEQASGWSAVQADAEADEDQLKNAEERVAEIAARMEARIAESGWLAGGAYSVADILAYSHAHCLAGLLPGIVNAESLPALTDWLGRIAARPAVAEALGRRTSDIAETVYSAPAG